MEKPQPRTRVIAVTSGKGGVGKSNVVVNLAIALAGFKKKAVILDADMGLANVDVLLGIKPRFTLRHVIAGQKDLLDIVVDGPGGIKIIPASSGIPDLADMPEADRARFLEKLRVLDGEAEVLLIDTPAGVASNVMGFVRATQEVIVITTPEPTAITDAYAMVKVISLQGVRKHVRLLVNMAANEKEAADLVAGISLIAKRFLGMDIDYLGHIEWDPNLPDAVRRQQPLYRIYPDSPASRAIRAIGAKLCNCQAADAEGDGIGGFLDRTSRFLGGAADPLPVPEKGATP